MEWSVMHLMRRSGLRAVMARLDKICAKCSSITGAGVDPPTSTTAA